jgi:hypothetical protein
MANNIDWGQGANNNDIGWGQGAVNNTINWGIAHRESWSGETDIVGSDGNVPINTVAPVISGTALVGNTLSSTTGTWTSDTGVIGYLYQWTRNGVNISEATSSTYTLVSADTIKSIVCKVAATDTDGTSAYVNSNTLVEQTDVVLVNAFEARVIADEGVFEAENCLLTQIDSLL